MKLLRAIAVFLLLAFAAPAGAAEWGSLEDVPEAFDPFEALAQRPPLPEDFIATRGLYADVHGSPRDRATVLRLAEHAEASIPRVAAALGVGTGPRMRITLADDQRAFAELQPGEPPGWADGTAYPHQALIYLRAPRIREGTARPLEQVLDHEITHVLLGQAFGHRPVPTWLQEGLAQWVAGEYGPETTERLARGMLGGGLLKLDDIKHGFPSDPVRAHLAYAQSADLIAFMASEYGPGTIPTLVKELSRGAPFNAAFRAATGEFADAVDEQWRGRLERSDLWLTPLTSEAMWWGLGAPILVLGWLAVRRRNRRKLERWRHEEAMQEALYKALERSYSRPQRAEEPWRAAPYEPPGGWVH
ncbi:MAG: hypothetical protein H6739_39205 [Alphaproteobacteria bacterium]|nr:hypothetical protein [Alphaproteobacteria bacterium]